MSNFTHVVGIGTSMGGLQALKKLFGYLPQNLNITFLIVQHTAEGAAGQLPVLLKGISSFKVKEAEDDDIIEPGMAYTSPSDKHLMVMDGKIVLGEGSRENGSRPSINNLFRSIAAEYQQRAIGVVLTGLLSDGTQGLKSIKSMGGTAIVQNPDDADFADMPSNALKNVVVDYVSSLEDIGPLLRVLSNKSVPQKFYKASHQMLREIEMAAQKHPDNEKNTILKSYQRGNLPVADSLFSILQMMQERTNMLENLAEHEMLNNRLRMARVHFSKAAECRLHTENLKKHLEEMVGLAS